MSLIDTYKQKFTECMGKNSEIGFVEKVSHPVVYVRGLPGCVYSEIVYSESGGMGMVVGLSLDYVEVLSFSEEPVVVGEKVSRSGEILKVPVGEGLLGQAIGPLCTSLHDNKVIVGIEEYREIKDYWWMRLVQCGQTVGTNDGRSYFELPVDKWGPDYYSGAEE